MTHEEEIAEIRKMLNLTLSNDVNKNYAKTRCDEELLEGVSYLPSSYTKLSVDIIVDTGDSYHIFNHPLCLYVVNPENDDFVYPITISTNPQTIDGNTIPNDVREFIVDNVQLLTDAANLIIDGVDFYDGVDAWLENKTQKMVAEARKPISMLQEMAIPRKEYINKIENLSPQILENWCLLHYTTITNQTQYHIHWRDELRGVLLTASRFKMKGNNDVAHRTKAITDVFVDRNEYTDLNILKMTVMNKFMIEKIDINSDAFNQVLQDCAQDMTKIIEVIANGDSQAILDYVQIV